MPGLSPFGRQYGFRLRARQSNAFLRLSLFGLSGFALACASAFLTLSTSAKAQVSEPVFQIGTMKVGTFEVVLFSVFAGAMCFALLAASWLIRERARISNENRQLRAAVAHTSARAERLTALTDVPDQRSVLWDAKSEKPEIFGNLPAEAGAPTERAKFLAFGRWLTEGSANSFEQALLRLRESAESFDLIVETETSTAIETQGRTVGGKAFVRFIPLTGDREALATLENEHTRLHETIDTMQALFEALPMPVWLRNKAGNLIWVNHSYAQAVDAKDSIAAVENSTDLLDTNERNTIATAHKSEDVFRGQLPATVQGDRRPLEVVEVQSHSGNAGLATDMNEVENAKLHLHKALESHAQTLDQLATAVAIFDNQRKLQFYNAAFQALWQLEPEFLEGAPDNGAVLDMLRSERKLPEQPDWRKWKDTLFTAYRSLEAQEHLWHLSDGRTLRVIANPHSQGGVTWVFENVTERLELESKFKALTQVQGETLDHLSEAVAVFSADGKLKLSNPAFVETWAIRETLISPDTHISGIAKHCSTLTEPGEDGTNVWQKLQPAITGFLDERDTLEGRMSLTSGVTLDYALVPLPNGQTLLNFVNVSDSVKIERALTDRNEALEAADQLKDTFIKHVSYELRSPLTNIIGFAGLLESPDFGKLNAKQAEYLTHISASSSVLLSLVNDILDLATVDAGIMELELGKVNIESAILGTVEAISERDDYPDVEMKISIADNVKSMTGDDTRIRQILYNLVSNAVRFSPEGSAVEISCKEDAGMILFEVSDNGPGIPKEIEQSIFNRFESRPNGDARRGTGLGLSIVKSFVELHGGTVEIISPTGKNNSGTTVRCQLPKKQKISEQAAE